jgi:hypothetical protein
MNSGACTRAPHIFRSSGSRAARFVFIGKSVRGKLGVYPPIANSKTVTANLHNVSHAQTIGITLANVRHGMETGNLGVVMDVLLADVNSNRDVNSGAAFLVQQQNGKSLPPTGSANFRRDINVNGSIDSGDVFIAQKQNPSCIP